MSTGIRVALTGLFAVVVAVKFICTLPLDRERKFDPSGAFFWWLPLFAGEAAIVAGLLIEVWS